MILSAHFFLHENSDMITFEQIDEFFKETRALHQEERIEWSIDGECRWSYYFIDSKRENLIPLADHLEAEGYDIAAIDESDDDGEYFLQVDKLETHTPDSLFKRGEEFETLAEQFNVADYDGMDVCGPKD